MRWLGLLTLLLAACRREPQFMVWRPDGLKEPRAVVVLTPGGDGDGRRLTADPEWRTFASRHGLALLGCRLPTAQGLLEELERQGLTSAPLLLWGMSAGGQFNYEFVAWKPERVGAFVVNKGGKYASSSLSREARMVPGLFIVGGKDEPWRADAIRSLLSANPGASWTPIEEPGVAHESGRSPELAREFFAKVLQSAKR